MENKFILKFSSLINVITFEVFHDLVNFLFFILAVVRDVVEADLAIQKFFNRRADTPLMRLRCSKQGTLKLIHVLLK